MPDPLVVEYSHVDTAVVVDWPTAAAVAVPTSVADDVLETRRIRQVTVPFDGYDADDPDQVATRTADTLNSVVEPPTSRTYSVPRAPPDPMTIPVPLLPPMSTLYILPMANSTQPFLFRADLLVIPDT